MAKPGTAFTWATDADFGSGPATGNPTKVNPPGWPNVTQGNVPDLTVVAEFQNTALNHIGLWVGWANEGSAAGAADAHLVETDASGDTAVKDLSAVDVTASGFAKVGTRLEEDHLHYREEFLYPTPSFDPDFWSTTGAVQQPAVNIGGVVELSTTSVSGEFAELRAQAFAFVSQPLSYVVEFIARITTVVTDVQVEMGTKNVVAVDMQSTVDGVAVQFHTGLGQTEWNLAGADGAVVVRDASSIAPVQNTWYRFRVEVATDGSAEMFIDGVSEATIAAASVGGNPGFLFMWCETLTTAQRDLEVDRVEFWQAPNA